MSDIITILVIDDDPQIRYALTELFGLQQWQAYAAESVEQGLALFRLQPPKLVLIDYHMPRINGVEGVRMLRRLSADVPIIVFTIDESQEVADAFLEAGANDFALKPVKALDIISRIKLHLRLLERAKPQQEVLSKGMSQGTLELIEEYLAGQDDYLTVNTVADGTGLAYQTVYRYLQHLTRIGRVEQLNTYGKVGRPKQLYRKK